jgi:putative transposase
VASFANEAWAYDFVHDVCSNGQHVKCLTVVDKFTSECLAIALAGSIRSGRVIEVLLARPVSERGAPQHLRSENGPEFVFWALLRWTVDESLHCLDSSRQAVAERHGRELQRSTSQ